MNLTYLIRAETKGGGLAGTILCDDVETANFLIENFEKVAGDFLEFSFEKMELVSMFPSMDGGAHE